MSYKDCQWLRSFGWWSVEFVSRTKFSSRTLLENWSSRSERIRSSARGIELVCSIPMLLC